MANSDKEINYLNDTVGGRCHEMKAYIVMDWPLDTLSFVLGRADVPSYLAMAQEVRNEQAQKEFASYVPVAASVMRVVSGLANTRKTDTIDPTIDPFRQINGDAVDCELGSGCHIPLRNS